MKDKLYTQIFGVLGSTSILALALVATPIQAQFSLDDGFSLGAAQAFADGGDSGGGDSDGGDGDGDGGNGDSDNGNTNGTDADNDGNNGISGSDGSDAAASNGTTEAPSSNINVLN